MSIFLSSLNIIKDWIDYNDHMNVSYYLLIFDKFGADTLNDIFKMGEQSAKTTKKSTMMVESHITSLSVLRTHRKLGIATKLMRATHRQMEKIYRVDRCSLRVRVTNRAAYTLYKEVLGYTIKETEADYYADGEDAYDMYMPICEKT